MRKGECNAKVIAIGKRTYYGKTTELVSVAKPKLHMEEVTAKILNYLLLIVVVLLGVMFLFSYIRREDFLNVIPLALVLIVFAVPVALPPIFTVSLELGAMETAKKGGPADQT